METRDLLSQVTRAVVSVLGLGGITFLGFHDKVTEGAVVAVYSTVLSLYGAAVLRAAQAAANGRGQPPRA